MLRKTKIQMILVKFSKNKLVLSCFSDNNIKYNMPERKIWTEDQDRILKFLKEERGERKWANIARLMECEFNIKGRTGKQCRERYHNHLDSSIINTEWTLEEEQILYRMHEQIGNKWSTISQKLPGRSDNCVKNHFYSKLRKSIRKLNKIIVDHFDNGFHQIKDKILSKIIESQQTKFKDSSKVDEELAEFCNSIIYIKEGIKNRLFTLQDEQIDEEVLQKARELIKDIEMFQNNYKKGYKAIKKKEYELLDKKYLKPPSSSIKRTNSISSQRSQDSNSYQSSNSYLSSCSDISQYDHQDNYKSKTTVSRRGSSNSDIINSDKNSDVIKSQKLISIDKQDQCEQKCKKQELEYHMDIQQLNHQHFIEQSNEMQFQNFYDNLIYEDTPVRARILGPSLMNLDQPNNFAFFHNESDQDNNSIEFKQEKQEQ